MHTHCACRVVDDASANVNRSAGRAEVAATCTRSSAEPDQCVVNDQIAAGLYKGRVEDTRFVLETEFVTGCDRSAVLHKRTGTVGAAVDQSDRFADRDRSVVHFPGCAEFEQQALS